MTNQSLLPARVLALAVAALASPAAAGQEPVKDLDILVKVADSLVDARALTIDGGFGRAINGKSFQQDALITHAGHQYVAYYDADRHVCIARRTLPAGDWDVLRFPDYDFRSNDAHNTISMGICGQDGTVHLAWDHHGHPLHYRRSTPELAREGSTVPWALASFGPIAAELEEGRPISITYPRFVHAPGGGLQFCYRRGRSGNGDRMLVDYDREGERWSGTRAIDSGAGVFEDTVGRSESRCSYPNGYDYGPRGLLHVTWVWRESSQGSNHGLHYAFSDDRGRSWRNNAGERLDGPPHVDSPGVTVVPVGRELGLMNTHGQAVDSRGRVHVVMWHCTVASLEAAGTHPGEHRWGPPPARRYHHYWRDEQATWHHVEIAARVGTRPKVLLDAQDRAIMVQTDHHRTQPDAAGDLVIHRATAAAGWKDWRIVHVERGPFGNEMLVDAPRFRSDGVLSVMVQERPEEAHEPTALRVLDFRSED